MDDILEHLILFGSQDGFAYVLTKIEPDEKLFGKIWIHERARIVYNLLNKKQKSIVRDEIRKRKLRNTSPFALKWYLNEHIFTANELKKKLPIDAALIEWISKTQL
jgi:hypothetical protein